MCFSDSRTVNLSEHLKIYAWYNKCEKKKRDKEGLFCLNVFKKRCHEINMNMYACFIDYENVFNKQGKVTVLSVNKCQDIFE